MSLNFKAKTGVMDVMLTSFHANFLFPVNLVWIGLFLFILHSTDILRFLRAGQWLWFGAACGLVFLHTLFWVVLVNTAIVGLNTLFGKFRTAYLEQDITIDEGFLTSTTTEGETRTALKNVVKYAETRGRIFFFLSGGQANAFRKAGLTPEQLLELGEAFRGRTSRIIPLVARFMVPFTAAVLLLVLVGLFKPEYSVQTQAGNLQAFWREDQAVISIPVVLTGRKTTLLEEILPVLALLTRKDPGSFLAAPAAENHAFIVRGGRLRSVTLLGGGDEMLGQIQPIGDDLLLMRSAKRRQEFSRFDGENFIPVGGEERDGLLKRTKECRRDRCGWQVFTLWDEDEDEEEDPDIDQQYRATLRLKSSELILGLDQTWVDRKSYVQDRLYTLKGLDPGGAIEELLAVKGRIRKVSGAEYRRLFPRNLSESVENAGGPGHAPEGLPAEPPVQESVPVPASSPPPIPATPTLAGGESATVVAPIGTAPNAETPDGEAPLEEAPAESIPAEAVPTGAGSQETGSEGAVAAPPGDASDVTVLQVEDDGNSPTADVEARP